MLMIFKEKRHISLNKTEQRGKYFTGSVTFLHTMGLLKTVLLNVVLKFKGFEECPVVWPEAVFLCNHAEGFYKY